MNLEKNLLRLLAVIAPRLLLAAGPYALEAAEIVASQMAVLLKLDEDHHFLSLMYSSEPILAEASARLTAANGWSQPRRALNHFIGSGIIDAGFRGELLTKIVYLMAVDMALSRRKLRISADGNTLDPLLCTNF